MLPEAPPIDVFTPSLVRRPPASQTRSQKVKYNFCVFCKNNGEDESYYLSHTLKAQWAAILDFKEDIHPRLAEQGMHRVHLHPQFLEDNLDNLICSFYLTFTYAIVHPRFLTPFAAPRVVQILLG